MRKNLNRASFVALCLAALTGLVGAQSLGSVIRVEGPIVTVNGGQKDLAVGQTLYVSRMGQPVAEIKIESVGEFSSKGRVERNLGTSYVLAGDQVQKQMPSGAAMAGSTIASVPVSPSPGGASRVATFGTPVGGVTATPQEAEESYRNFFNQRTKKHSFQQKAASRAGMGMVLPGSEPMEGAMIAGQVASSIGPGGFYASPGMLVFSAASAYEAHAQREVIFGKVEAHCTIEATYWDLPLMEKYAQYVATTSGKTSPSAYAALRSSLIAQKGIDKSEVFEVRLKNTGKIKIQLSPFHWHMFLMGPNNSRLAPIRYDQVLDRQLNPGEEVAGNVYFPKVATLGDKVTVFYEDVYGNKSSENFPLRPANRDRDD